ncbi:fimbrillin family protein [Elizabethkingia ursingii]|nr:fimbrillin family protein [Elizabethkingia ursingii]MCL1669625.1 fimbrillin family protein [Elizabethkingia ursingii]
MAAAAPIQRAIKFRVVVYNASGQYDSSYIYSISVTGAVTPDSGTAMKLNGGQNYTFIAYSYNTNVAPNENLTGSNLSTASITFSSMPDFMYYKASMTPSGEAGAQNNLNIVLKHSFSTVLVNVDSSQTNGYNITNITGATLAKAYPTATVALASGTVTSTGTATTIAVPFPATLNSNNVTATTAVVVNNATNTADGTFNMASLTVGPLTGSNIAFNGLTIQPGVRYNLTIRLVPQDIFFDDNTSVPGTTIKTARINGKFWMRYNLGVDVPLNPNPDLATPTNAGLFGNYYQWGKSNVVATGYTQPGIIDPWDRTVPPNNAWNAGTEAAPVKTSNDPCPNNYRVPTMTELQDLANSTIQTNTSDASWDIGSATNYASVKVFTSKRDKNVKLSFPASGYRDSNDGQLLSIIPRGKVGIYWSSSFPNGSARYQNMQLYKDNVDFSFGADNSNFGENIRCIRVN